MLFSWGHLRNVGSRFRNVNSFIELNENSVFAIIVKKKLLKLLLNIRDLLKDN
jgi:hypothetical protein